MRKSFYTLFTRAENVHLIKDVGMVPYVLHRDYEYASVLATFKNSETYSYLDNEVKGLRISFIKRVFKHRSLNTALYILKNFRKIDALQMYHFEIDQIDVMGLYMLLRKVFFLKSFTYIKCDGSDRFIDTDLSKIRFTALRKKVIRKIDLYTVETTADYNIIKQNNYYKHLNLKVMYNGFDDQGQKIDLKNTFKSNIILTVGRLGTHQKNTEFLLEAFKMSKASKNNWSLYLAGQIADDFSGYLSTFFQQNPSLKDKVKVLGNISDRDQLRRLYCEASVFILTSRSEGSPLVVPEALACGCYCLLSNPIHLAADVMNKGQYGRSFSIEDQESLPNIFDDLDAIPYNLLKNEIQNFAYSTLYWKENVAVIDTAIQQKFKNFEKN